MEVTGETFTDVTGRMNRPNEWFGCGMSAAYERLLLTEGRTNQKTVLSLAEKGIELAQPIESLFHWANLKSAFQDASLTRSLQGIFFLVFSALAFVAFLARFYY